MHKVELPSPAYCRCNTVLSRQPFWYFARTLLRIQFSVLCIAPWKLKMHVMNAPDIIQLPHNISKGENPCSLSGSLINNYWMSFIPTQPTSFHPWTCQDLQSLSMQWQVWQIRLADLDHIESFKQCLFVKMLMVVGDFTSPEQSWIQQCILTPLTNFLLIRLPSPKTIQQSLNWPRLPFNTCLSCQLQGGSQNLEHVGSNH